ncbi:MAG: endonuclease domain-containing protein [Bacteroidales bacterium]|nr:endonuclease domain-containing protein [Bacteroidales bacterium]
MPAILHNIKYLEETRKHLRRNMTEAELILWSMLKDKKLRGRKFRRQHSIGYYIADFYCPSEKLVIELDGQHHYTSEGIENDQDRDKHLGLMGIKVLRFENKQVKENLTGVLKTIKEHFNK